MAKYDVSVPYEIPRRASCGHVEYSNGRCAEMICSNYVSKHIGSDGYIVPADNQKGKV